MNSSHAPMARPVHSFLAVAGPVTSSALSTRFCKLGAQAVTFTADLQFRGLTRAIFSAKALTEILTPLQRFAVFALG
jgi:hypothetical protein